MSDFDYKFLKPRQKFVDDDQRRYAALVRKSSKKSRKNKRDYKRDKTIVILRKDEGNLDQHPAPIVRLPSYNELNVKKANIKDIKKHMKNVFIINARKAKPIKGSNRVNYNVYNGKNNLYYDINDNSLQTKYNQMFNIKRNSNNVIKSFADDIKYEIMNDYQVRNDEYYIKPKRVLNMLDKDSNDKVNQYKLINLDDAYLITSITIKNPSNKYIELYIGNNEYSTSLKKILREIKHKNKTLSVDNELNRARITEYNDQLTRCQPYKVGEILYAKRIKMNHHTKLVKPFPNANYKINLNNYWTKCKVTAINNKGIMVEWTNDRMPSGGCNPKITQITVDEFDSRIKGKSKRSKNDLKRRKKTIALSKIKRKSERVAYGLGKSEKKTDYKNKGYIKWNKIIIYPDTTMKNITQIHGINKGIKGDWIKIYPHNTEFDLYGVNVDP
mmetsp:Transcript_27855/g.34014  ORF Transcript_27855/g.34014 Transcript_27855/m.34014 type:complete len:442 (+) Transcript_27855:60-1385(+)